MISDHQMLREAESRLASHLRTRPATHDEAMRIREYLLSLATSSDRGMHSVITPTTAAEIGRGKGAVEIQQQEGVAVARSVQSVLRSQRDAHHLRLQADAWKCDSSDMSQQWEATRRELQSRVDYYAALVGSST